MRQDGKIDYVEFAAADMGATQAFYREAFGWSFVDYGPTYASFAEGVDGGFQADAAEAPRAPLVVIYAADIEAALAKVRAAGAEIVRSIFSYPGGRRFHFLDPAGTELAVYQPD
jgi:uncharacterized protein